VRIILTGGIASGKSTIAKELLKYDISIIDSDKISKNIFTRNITKIQKMFATDLKGDALRKYVGDIIFTSPKMRFQLESFMHPKIKNIIKKRERELKGKKYIIDIPLYFETKSFMEDDDFVILVSIPYKDQVERLMRRNNLTKEEANKRIIAQLPTAIKERKSDYIIENTGTIDELKSKVNNLVNKIL